MMPRASRRLAAGEDQLDRMSDLPEEILHSILDRMPVSDAARTSILSRYWRFIWMAHPNLVFNECWYEKIAKRRRSEDEFFHVINKILLQHIGNIESFTLHIPPIVNSTSRIDQWMLFLSRNGIKELELSNTSQNRNPYKLPSCVLCCPTLTRLVASNCVFEPPKSHEAFRKLTSLIFRDITFGPSFAMSVLKIPLLEYFHINYCSGVHHLNVYIPNVSRFFVTHSRDVDLSCFKTGTSVRAIAFSLPEVENSALRKRISVPMLLDKWSRLWWLAVDGSLLKSPDEHFNPKHLSEKTDHLRVLQLHWFNFADLKQIGSALCLLRSVPNLRALVIQKNEINPNISSEDEEIVLKHLNPDVFAGLKLHELKFVIFQNLNGSRAELLFIKLLLAHSPSLQVILIEESASLSSSEEELRILRELIQFPRASPVAELKCVRMLIPDSSATNTFVTRVRTMLKPIWRAQ